MKFKVPAFLEGIEAPVDGEVAMRKFAASQMGENAVVVGIDEVGRGPLAGPVVACAAVLKSPDALLTLNDSKKLTRPNVPGGAGRLRMLCRGKRLGRRN